MWYTGIRIKMTLITQDNGKPFPAEPLSTIKRAKNETKRNIL